MSASIDANKNIVLESIDNFVDGAAVKRVGNLNFSLCKENLHDMITIPEGKICQIILCTATAKELLNTCRNTAIKLRVF